MRSLSDTLARLKRMPRGVSSTAPGSSRLRPLGPFGSNPGELKGWVHVPESAGAGAPLVVVLHGCTQNAAGYDESSGWSRLADQAGFVLLFPEQQRSNNPNLCFNWFSDTDAARGKGEALSIRDMVKAVEARHETDPRRAFVTGLSAGGAMTATMLATYPEVFAGGAVIAGLPFGVAHSVPEAFERMRGHDAGQAAELSRLVRAASGHPGPWPTLSVWHGSADQTVDDSNASALVEQWRPLHGVPAAPDRVELVNGYPRRVWRDSKGRDVIEEYRIAGLSHGTPLDTQTTSHGEKAAPFMLEAGISSTRLISRFWGIVPDEAEDHRATAPTEPAPRPAAAVRAERSSPPAQAGWGGQANIGKTIDDALRSAGLLK